MTQHMYLPHTGRDTDQSHLWSSYLYFHHSSTLAGGKTVSVQGSREQPSDESCQHEMFIQSSVKSRSSDAVCTSLVPFITLLYTTCVVVVWQLKPPFSMEVGWKSQLHCSLMAAARASLTALSMKSPPSWANEHNLTCLCYMSCVDLWGSFVILRL